jgi:hypothetical protein
MRGENLVKETAVKTLRQKWDAVQSHLGECGRRIWTVAKAQILGRGGVAIVYEITGMSRSAITQGIAEMAYLQDAAPPDRARMAGGGRKKQMRSICAMNRNRKTFLMCPVIRDPERYSCVA